MAELNTAVSHYSKRDIFPLYIRNDQEKELPDSTELEILESLQKHWDVFGMLNYIHFYEDSGIDSAGSGLFSLYLHQQSSMATSLSKEAFIYRFITCELPSMVIQEHRSRRHIELEQSITREIEESIITDPSTSDDSVDSIAFEELYRTQLEQQAPVKSRKRNEPIDWDQELQWFRKNQWVFERYKGEWVAVKGDKLIIHDPGYQRVHTFCDENDIMNPFVQYIPKTEQEWNIGVSNYAVLEK